MDPVVVAKIAKMAAEQLKDEKKRNQLICLVLVIVGGMLFLCSIVTYMITHPLDMLFGGDGKTQLSINESTVTIKEYSNVEDTVWQYLKDIGFSDYGAAGVMGNIRIESTFNTAACHNGIYFGLCQWGMGRWDGNVISLKNFANLKGTDWTDLQTQLSFFEVECRGSFPNVYKQMMNATDEKYACDYFCTYYEICVGELGNWAYSMVNGKAYQCLGDRRKYAEFYYNHYADLAGKVDVK